MAASKDYLSKDYLSKDYLSKDLSNRSDDGFNVTSPKDLADASCNSFSSSDVLTPLSLRRVGSNAQLVSAAVNLGDGKGLLHGDLSDASGNTKILIIIGSPSCSGKTGFREAAIRIFKELYPNANLVEISSDQEGKKEKIKFDDPDSEEARLYKAARNTEKMAHKLKLVSDAIKSGSSIIYDSRLAGGEKSEGIKRAEEIVAVARRDGYVTVLIAPFVTTENFLERILRRCAADGKATDIENRLSGHQSFSANWDGIKNMFDRVALYDNNVVPERGATEHNPQLVFIKNGSVEDILNNQEYDTFLDKANINLHEVMESLQGSRRIQVCMERSARQDNRSRESPLGSV